MLDNALADICRYIEALVALHLPDQYASIKAFVDVLPLNHSPTSYPFSSFVINLQATAKAHKDEGDDTVCVSIPFGNWTQGQLVLHELGMVLDLTLGDVVIFPSCYITHFGLDFAGVRCSLILFSDKHGKDWVRFRNGWKDHMVVHDNVDMNK